MYYLGQALHYDYRFDEAIIQFNKFRDIVAKWNINIVKDIDRWIEVCNNAKELTSKPVECTITNLGDSVNCQFADYSPVISADESMLVFTSRREGTGGKDNKTIYDKFLEDIWICNRGPYGTWSKAKGISRNINTESNEATIGLSADGQELYLYRDDKGDGNIYKSTLDGDYWNSPIKIDANNVNSKKWEPSACVSADGQTLYFVSDRKGGFGGRDIYQARLQPDKTWGTPENLGQSINTHYDEDAPFLHPDGFTFFFSSTGHNSMGGFDVFYSTKVAKNVWAKPINLGFPINTTDDDIYFVTSSDGRRAYYSSFKPEGKGEKDLYMVSFPKAFVKSVAILVGYLKNKDGSIIPKNSLITSKSTKGNIVSSKPNESNGKFIQTLFPGEEYEITIETNGQKIFTEKFYLPEDSSYQNLGRGFFQRTINIGDTAKIFYAKSKSDSMGISNLIPIDGVILLSTNINDVAKKIAIQLLNTQGNLIGSTVTDNEGKFNFKNIPSDQKYILKIDENDPMLKSHTQYYLANNKGDIVLPSTQEGNFIVFKNIDPELNKLAKLELKDPPIMMGKLSTDSKGKNAIGNTPIELLDKSGKVVFKNTTDANGNFKFENLLEDNYYSISINEKGISSKTLKEIFLTNQENAVIRKVSKLGNYFVFKALPTDLNKLKSLDFNDASQLITMRGKILKSANHHDGFNEIEITLKNEDGIAIKKSKTDKDGNFKFEELNSDKNYTIEINENDTQLINLEKVYLSNEANKIIKEINLSKKESFINLPADLKHVSEMKNIQISSQSKNNINEIIHNKPMYPGDENFDFVVYFPYNKKEIDISVGSFLSLMDKVSKTIDKNGKATIIIYASSSNVPTTSYSSNEELADIRANEIKDKVRSSISLNNTEDSKLSYEITKKVQGPAYNNDTIQNRKEYEKWQYIKVIVK